MAKKNLLLGNLMQGKHLLAFGVCERARLRREPGKYGKYSHRVCEKSFLSACVHYSHAESFTNNGCFQLRKLFSGHFYNYSTITWTD